MNPPSTGPRRCYPANCVAACFKLQTPTSTGSVVYNLGTVLLEQAISRHLPEPFFTDRQLQRWNDATTTLIRRGTYRTETCK